MNEKIFNGRTQQEIVDEILKRFETPEESALQERVENLVQGGYGRRHANYLINTLKKLNTTE